MMTFLKTLGYLALVAFIWWALSDGDGMSAFLIFLFLLVCIGADSSEGKSKPKSSDEPRIGGPFDGG